MVLNAIHKQSSKQSFHKVSSEATICRCSSKQLFLIILCGCFPVNIAKLLRTAFLKETSDGCFFQFDEVTVQYWASICQPLLNQKHNVGWFLIKRFVDLFRVCYVISRDHSSTFFLVNLQETNLSKERHSSKGYLFSYQIFDSLDILISAELSLVLKKFKLYQEN